MPTRRVGPERRANTPSLWHQSAPRRRHCSSGFRGKPANRSGGLWTKRYGPLAERPLCPCLRQRKRRRDNRDRYGRIPTQIPRQRDRRTDGVEDLLVQLHVRWPPHPGIEQIAPENRRSKRREEAATGTRDDLQRRHRPAPGAHSVDLGRRDQVPGRLQATEPKSTTFAEYASDI